MKVGFDGVLLGAWTNVADGKRFLDVGTGTGLIALMLAQRTEHLPNAHVDAVEIEPSAYHEAQSNVARSPWSDRVTCYHDSVQRFAEYTAANYDTIVCNPPFFESTTEATPSQRTLARHMNELPLQDLLDTVKIILRKTGRFSVILPIDRQSACEQIAGRNQLYCRRRTVVKPNPHAKAKRILLEFQNSTCTTHEDVIEIETERRHEYSAAFRELTSAFYQRWKQM